MFRDEYAKLRSIENRIDLNEKYFHHAKETVLGGVATGKLSHNDKIEVFNRVDHAMPTTSDNHTVSQRVDLFSRTGNREQKQHRIDEWSRRKKDPDYSYYNNDVERGADVAQAVLGVIGGGVIGPGVIIGLIQKLGIFGKQHKLSRMVRSIYEIYNDEDNILALEVSAGMQEIYKVVGIDYDVARFITERHFDKRKLAESFAEFRDHVIKNEQITILNIQPHHDRLNEIVRIFQMDYISNKTFHGKPILQYVQKVELLLQNFFDGDLGSLYKEIIEYITNAEQGIKDSINRNNYPHTLHGLLHVCFDIIRYVQGKNNTYISHDKFITELNNIYNKKNLMELQQQVRFDLDIAYKTNQMLSQWKIQSIDFIATKYKEMGESLRRRNESVNTFITGLKQGKLITGGIPSLANAVLTYCGKQNNLVTESSKIHEECQEKVRQLTLLQEKLNSEGNLPLDSQNKLYNKLANVINDKLTNKGKKYETILTNIVDSNIQIQYPEQYTTFADKLEYSVRQILLGLSGNNVNLAISGGDVFKNAEQQTNPVTNIIVNAVNARVTQINEELKNGDTGNAIQFYNIYKKHFTGLFNSNTKPSIESLIESFDLLNQLKTTLNVGTLDKNTVQNVINTELNESVKLIKEKTGYRLDAKSTPKEELTRQVQDLMNQTILEDKLLCSNPFLDIPKHSAKVKKSIIETINKRVKYLLESMHGLVGKPYPHNIYNIAKFNIHHGIAANQWAHQWDLVNTPLDNIAMGYLEHKNHSNESIKKTADGIIAELRARIQVDDAKRVEMQTRCGVLQAELAECRKKHQEDKAECLGMGIAWGKEKQGLQAELAQWKEKYKKDIAECLAMKTECSTRIQKLEAGLVESKEENNQLAVYIARVEEDNRLLDLKLIATVKEAKLLVQGLEEKVKAGEVTAQVREQLNALTQKITEAQLTAAKTKIQQQQQHQAQSAAQLTAANTKIQQQQEQARQQQTQAAAAVRAAASLTAENTRLQQAQAAARQQQEEQAAARQQQEQAQAQQQQEQAQAQQQQEQARQQQQEQARQQQQAAVRAAASLTVENTRLPQQQQEQAQTATAVRKEPKNRTGVKDLATSDGRADRVERSKKESDKKRSEAFAKKRNAVTPTPVRTPTPVEHAPPPYQPPVPTPTPVEHAPPPYQPPIPTPRPAPTPTPPSGAALATPPSGAALATPTPRPTPAPTYQEHLHQIRAIPPIGAAPEEPAVVPVGPSRKNVDNNGLFNIINIGEERQKSRQDDRRLQKNGKGEGIDRDQGRETRQGKAYTLRKDERAEKVKALREPPITESKERRGNPEPGGTGVMLPISTMKGNNQNETKMLNTGGNQNETDKDLRDRRGSLHGNTVYDTDYGRVYSEERLNNKQLKEKSKKTGTPRHINVTGQRNVSTAQNRKGTPNGDKKAHVLKRKKRSQSGQRNVSIKKDGKSKKMWGWVENIRKGKLLKNVEMKLDPLITEDDGVNMTDGKTKPFLDMETEPDSSDSDTD